MNLGKAQGKGLAGSREQGAGRRTSCFLFLLRAPCSMLFLVSCVLCPLAFCDELKDVRPPVALASDWLWVWILLVALLLALVIWAILRSVKRSRKKVVVIPPKDPWVIAFEELEALAKEPFLKEGRVKEYYSALSNIVRHYIEGRFLIRAPEMTTEEFMDAAWRSGHLTDAQKMLLRDLLDASDMVKFAKFAPTQEAMQDAWRLSRRFVEETVPSAVDKAANLPQETLTSRTNNERREGP